MILFILGVLAAEPRWAGIPLTRLPALSLAEPSLSSRASVWQAADAQGGWARVYWYADADAAAAAFQFQRGAATTIPQPTRVIAGADEAVGGASYILARSRNVVIEVRTTGAEARATAMVAALVAEGVVADAPSGVDPATWDAFGRRLSDTAP